VPAPPEIEIPQVAPAAPPVPDVAQVAGPTVLVPNVRPPDVVDLPKPGLAAEEPANVGTPAPTTTPATTTPPTTTPSTTTPPTTPSPEAASDPALPEGKATVARPTAQRPIPISAQAVRQDVLNSMRDVQRLPNTNPDKAPVLRELQELLKKIGDLEQKQKQGRVNVSKELEDIDRRHAELDDRVADAVVEVNKRRAEAAPRRAQGRLQQDIDAETYDIPEASEASTIGTSPAQEAQLRADIAKAKALGATDIRVNQAQVNASEKMVGINRPDLQYTLNGQRYYIEYEREDPGRGPIHTSRIKANDPSAIVEVKIIP
jgi:hypothetical protein